MITEEELEKHAGEITADSLAIFLVRKGVLKKGDYFELIQCSWSVSALKELNEDNWRKQRDLAIDILEFDYGK